MALLIRVRGPDQVQGNILYEQSCLCMLLEAQVLPRVLLAPVYHRVDPVE